MIIKDVEIQTLDIPVVRPHAMAIGTTTSLVTLVVRVSSSDGTSGYGEAPFMVGHSQAGETPESAMAMLGKRLAPAVIGLSAMDQESLHAAMSRRVPGNLRAKGAIVMAAYDLAGQILGTPVHNLLGGRFRPSVPLSWSLPLIDTAAAVEEALRMVERGWRILKLKMGRPDPREDVAVARAVRAAVGPDVSLRADANQAYDAKTAISVIRQIEDLEIAFFEQPTRMHDIRALRQVSRATGVRIMADEAATDLTGLANLIRADAIDDVSIYVIGPGGLHQSKKMVALADAFGLRGYIGGALETGIGAAAGVHLAASSPAVSLGCEMNGQFLIKDNLVADPLEFTDGALQVPSGPGLGVALSTRSLEKYRAGEIVRVN